MLDQRKRTIQEAETYIQTHLSLVNPEYRPAFHAVAPVGWINDPNGFCWFHGQYHLFGQYHPYSAKWGPMHWGHWVSPDLIHWEWAGVAMAPDQEYDQAGVFSGTALIENDVLIVMYTGVSLSPDGRLIQQQCIARSKDGYHFEKDPRNPVIRSEDLPADVPADDFRDPKLFRTPDGYRAIMAARNAAGGELLVYSSQDLASWKLAGTCTEGISRMLECPDYHRIDGKDLLVFCAIGLPEAPGHFPSPHTAVYMTGSMNDQYTAFQGISPEAVDMGLNFYAPQAADTPDGCILTSWMPGPGGTIPTDDLGHQWAGCMVLPRQLHIREDRLYQKPVEAVRKLRRNKISIHQVMEPDQPFIGSHGKCFEWELKLKADHSVRMDLFRSEGNGFLVTWDPASGMLTMDRNGCGHDMSGKAPERVTAHLFTPGNAITLNIFVDTCTVELFANEGERVMSANVYPKGNTYTWAILSDGQFEITGDCYELAATTEV